MGISEALQGQLTTELRGQPVWGVARGVGSFLDVEFGPAKPEPDSAVGSWHLWVYMADWRIEHNGRVVAGSNDEPEFLDEQLGHFGPAVFERFAVAVDTGDTWFQCSDGWQLVIFASARVDDDSEAWILNRPDGSTVSGGPANRWSMEGA